jgi:chitinase
VSHAPQAPYFSSSFSASGSYLNIHNNTGKFIDFYNIQFYNQGVNTPYSTYQELFVDSGIHNPNTSLFQIINQGVEAEKVVLGKPVTQNDAYNTGFVASSSLKALLKQAVNDSNNPGWTPSVMYWQYLSDLSGASIAETMSYGK